LAGALPIGEVAPADGLLPEQARVDADGRSFHAYVHIPFCRVRCGYCDFNTYTATELEGASQSGYAAQVIDEIRFSKGVLAGSQVLPRRLKSVFFGGGTPTQLPAEDLVAILGELTEQFGLLPNAEVTTEANPDTVDLDYLAKLKAGGFTRVSFGMQSAEPSVLKTLERTHNPENVPLVVAAARAAGLSCSVDLIYGAPGETLEQWRNSLEAAISLEPDHISAYSLIVEDGTKLARQIRSGELEEPDEDLQADKYELADELLTKAGFAWYEVSNWAKVRPGADERSLHNIAYWQSQDWWGYGPGAHSHVGGVRWWNVKHPSAYGKRIAEAVSPALGRESLDDRTRLEESILLEIRVSDGLSVSVAKLASARAAELIAGFIADGLVDAQAAIKGRLVLTLKGRLLADSLVRSLLA
jgi:putative oxygen-independent coproporphyrinogen III oxidase